MQCPNCALYHPARYEVCVSCGTRLLGDGDLVQKAVAPAVTTKSGRGNKDKKAQKDSDSAPDHVRYVGASAAQVHAEEGTAPPKRRGLPLGVGIGIAAFILCASGGVTFFFLTKPPEDQRLLLEGQKELRDGQYAFALKTLTKAAKGKPDDPRILLSLARAYVGVDQVEKAWECITQAQQLGAGVVAEPQLASDLANYYRQRNQYQRAVELLRPLAANNVAGKKAELADLDASWGDDCLRDGDYKQALKCWEEVREMHEGSRVIEADGRLSSIYQKIADQMSMRGDSEEALKYLSKLNVMAPSSSSYEKTAELYQKEGKLELAIDQMRKAVKLAGDATFLNKKLAALMVSRGKELLDSGDSDSGYGYLQQAQALDPKAKAPPATVRNVHIDVEQSTGFVHASGEVWNPGSDVMNALSLRGELYDSKYNKVVWSKEQHVVDEFVPPLGPRESRSFDMITGVGGSDPNTTQFRVYLNGALYKAYSLNGKAIGGDTGIAEKSDHHKQGTGGDGFAKLRPPITTNPAAPPLAPDVTKSEKETLPPVAPNAVPSTGPSSEEKTLKDLE